jgi:predicted N-acetyltransferase YhbS
MDITIRPAREADAPDCGRICYEGFRVVTERYGYPLVFGSHEIATRRLAGFIAHPSVYAIVAEANDRERRIVGFNFLSERDPIRAIGPIAVDPALPRQGIGRRLMAAALERARGARGARGVRLVQESYNIESFALYAALGFAAREACLVVAGRPAGAPPAPDWEIRPLRDTDIPACEALHLRVHGHTRSNELRDALATGAPLAALQDSRVRAYMTMPTSWQANHGVAETDDDLRALILGAAQMRAEPLSFMLPVRRDALLRWCLAHGLRAARPMILMTMGEYREPDGGYMPSVLY